MEEGEICEHCGATVRQYHHHLNTTLVTALRVLYEAGPQVHAISDLPMTYTQRSNFQKLQYWGLIEKVRGPDGKFNRGLWRLTSLGHAFVTGETRVPSKAITFRGELVRTTGSPVGVGDHLPTRIWRWDEWVENAVAGAP